MTPCLCASYKQDILRGVHSDTDRYMLALYTSDAINEFTTAYTPTGEVVGPGYDAGGRQLKGFRVEDDGSAAVLTFDDIEWPRVTVTGVLGGLVYNASKNNRAVGVIALGQKVSATNGPFTLYFPEPTADAGVFVID